MLSAEQFKEALGSAAEKYSEDQLEWMRLFCDRFADLFFTSWLRGRNMHNVGKTNHEENGTHG